MYFFFNVTATTEIYTLSLHDALPILLPLLNGICGLWLLVILCRKKRPDTRYLIWPIFAVLDRKSTRLNSSHVEISYAVFCLKKKNIHNKGIRRHLVCASAGQSPRCRH